MAAKSTKKSASKKKATPKAKQDDKRPVLDWHIPGHAKATVFFSSPRSSVHIELTPSTDSSASQSTLIGDSITADDILDLELFDTILLSSTPDYRFVTYFIVNLEQHEIEIELAFMFVGATDNAGTKYQFKIPPAGFVSESIPVKIKGG